MDKKLHTSENIDKYIVQNKKNLMEKPNLENEEE